jgi:hypothetical protein
VRANSDPKKPSRVQLLDAAILTEVDHVDHLKYDSEEALKSLLRRYREFTRTQFRTAAQGDRDVRKR